ncbi:hypothetical protein, partial [Kocuria rosea]|uniref:hypothetical protein n=1 Tax=Kocuria rosea TaxID=1275 RepID=UPI001643F9D6
MRLWKKLLAVWVLKKGGERGRMGGMKKRMVVGRRMRMRWMRLRMMGRRGGRMMRMRLGGKERGWGGR